MLFCRFTRAVEGLLRISDYHRREVLHALRAAQQLRSRSRAADTRPTYLPPESVGHCPKP